MSIFPLSSQIKDLILLLLILAAGVEFGVRGPLRAARQGHDWNDFLSPYIQARSWLHGEDPYSTSTFVSEWPESLHKPTFVTRDAADGTLVAKRGVPSPYPLTSFVLLAPIALLPWSIAIAIWTGINLTAFAFSVAGLVSLAGLTWHDSRAKLFLAISLGLAPLHTGIATQNPVVLVVGLCVAGVWAATRKWNLVGGVLLGAAVCLKPQVGLCFVFYYLVRRRWAIVAVASASTLGVALFALARLAASKTPWVATYLEDTANVFAPGAINDFTPLNPVWFNMINLQVLLWQAVRSTPIANLLAIAMGLLLLGFWLWLMRKREPVSPLLEIGCLVTLSLLPVYHRSYDAALLIWPLSWGVMSLGQRAKNETFLILACILPFLFPGMAALNQLSTRGGLAPAMIRGWWWNALVMSHEVWALVILSLLLLIFLRGESDLHLGSGEGDCPP